MTSRKYGIKIRVTGLAHSPKFAIVLQIKQDPTKEIKKNNSNKRNMAKTNPMDRIKTTRTTIRI